MEGGIDSSNDLKCRRLELESFSSRLVSFWRFLAIILHYVEKKDNSLDSLAFQIMNITNHKELKTASSFLLLKQSQNQRWSL